jgi:hypothetical protein
MVIRFDCFLNFSQTFILIIFNSKDFISELIFSLLQGSWVILNLLIFFTKQKLQNISQQLVDQSHSLGNVKENKREETGPSFQV